MINPRKCLVASNPPHSYGDCIAACVRTILDRDDVPHCFNNQDTEAAWGELRAWLAEQGKCIALFGANDHKQIMSQLNPNIQYILLHATHRGDHAIICRDGAVVHDPAWCRSEIVGPHSQLGVYAIGIIGDLVL